MNSTVAANVSAAPSVGFDAITSLTYFLLFVATYASYALVFVAMAKHRKDFASAYYKYIMSLAIGEFMYAVYYGVFGALCQALTYCPVSMLANTVLSGIGFIGWPIEVATDIAIAFDRFVAVCFYSNYAAISSGKLPFVIIAATWLYAMVYASPLYSLLAPLYYDPTQASQWSDSPLMPVVGYVQMCGDIVMLAASTLLYTLTFATMWKRRKQSLVGQTSAMSRQQRTLVMQGCCHMVMVGANDALYYGYVQPYGSSAIVSFISNAIYLLVPLNNVLLLLLLNSVVREKVCTLFRSTQSDTSHATTTGSRRRIFRRSNTIAPF